jgi:hypothetical protein
VECEETEAALNIELQEIRGRAGLEGMRKRIFDDAERNTLKREEYTKKQQSAQVELLRREGEQARLAEFQEKARATADTLDDLDAEQRRQLLLDLHAVVYVARLDNDHQPRLELAFHLTAEAAAHVRGEQWQAKGLQTRRGEYITFVEQGWPPRSHRLDSDRTTVIDLSLASDDDDDTPPDDHLSGGSKLPSSIS